MHWLIVMSLLCAAPPAKPNADEVAARRAEAEGQWSTAVMYWSSALRKSPRHHDWLLARGRANVKVAALPDTPPLTAALALHLADADLIAARDTTTDSAVKKVIETERAAITRTLRGDPSGGCRTTWKTAPKKRVFRHANFRAAARDWTKTRYVEGLDGDPDADPEAQKPPLSESAARQICGEVPCDPKEPSSAIYWDGNVLTLSAFVPYRGKVLEVRLPSASREYQCSPEGDVLVEPLGKLLRVRAFVTPPSIEGVDEDGKPCDPDEVEDCMRGCGTGTTESVDYLFNPRSRALYELNGAPLDFTVKGTTASFPGCKPLTVR